MELRTPTTMVAVLVVLTLLAVVPEPASARRLIVGGNQGWSPNVNYTIWARDQHFYFGDWLYFVYDRHQQNVIEVNQTDYETCNSNTPLKNWTTGAGRDVVPLNQTRHRYFISGNGFCFSGMKLSVKTVKPPPPPKAAPIKSAASTTSYRTRLVLPLAFAVAAVWDSFVLGVW